MKHGSFCDFSLLEAFFALQFEIYKGVYAIQYGDDTLAVDIDKCFYVDDDAEFILNPFTTYVTPFGEYAFDADVFEILSEAQEFCDDNEFTKEMLESEDLEVIVQVISALKER